MGYAVQVDPDALTAGARRLAAAAETLDTLAGRVRSLCTGAGAALGAADLARALDDTGRETARAVGQGGAAVADLGTRTGLAGEGYRALERSLAGRWRAGPDTAPAAGARGPVEDGGR